MNEIFVESMIHGKVEFPEYFALHYLFAIKLMGPIAYRPVWVYFIDGFDESLCFNLN